MPRSHIPHWTLPPSFPSLRATFATRKSPTKSNRTIEASLKRRLQLSPVQKPPESSSQSPKEKPSSPDAVSSALRDANAPDNNLLAPVHVPEDPDGVLKEKHPAAQILFNSAIVIQRKLELMNLTIGFEQANKYVILDPQGNHLGFIAERGLGMRNVMARQMFKTHRSFETHVFDKHGREVLRASQLGLAGRMRRTNCIIVSSAFLMVFFQYWCLRSLGGFLKFSFAIFSIDQNVGV